MSRDRLVLWLAWGLGAGLAPKGPGTAGSLVGLAWAALLLWPGDAAFFWTAAIAATGVAVWVCGEAERILGQHDPGSIVLDEVVAIPFCLAVPLAMTHQGGAAAWPWWLWVVVFVLFRVFDIAKPWPVRQVQRLPGGWGVVADDLLAAGWVNVVFFLMRQFGVEW